MGKPNKKKLFLLVREEARGLLKHAKKYERKRLEFTLLSPESPHRCIYGQMTGYCESDRAGKLIYKCARRVYSCAKYVQDGFFEKRKLNGKPDSGKGGHISRFFSPIEMCIYHYPENNERLIKYLRGESKKLVLK